MTQASLTAMTIGTIDNCGRAASRTVRAYRLGGKRLVGAVDRTVKAQVTARAAKVVPFVTERIDALRGSMSELVAKGIDAVADSTDKAIDYGHDTAVAQVKKVSALASNIDNATVASGLRTAARLAMPGAQVALALSGRIVAGSDKLVDTVGGAKAPQRAAKKAQTVARRAAKTVRKAAAKAPRKAASAATAA